MRTTLKNSQPLQLYSAGAETPAKELVIENLIGMGANIVAYEATDKTGQIHFVLKECYPDTGAERLPDGAIGWKSPEIEAGAKARMQRAYEMQIALQNEAATENTNTHLVDTIYTANNTLYTITDHRNATTYNKVEDKNLQEIFITARSIARAVKAYHDNGYLHLDIKPHNVMIMPETRDMVLLLDFDSITKIDQLAVAPLSYSPNYAAPEQIQGRVSKICAATDVYAIGAIVFRRIIGRLPNLEDQSIFSDWVYSDNPLFAKLSMKTRRLTTEFFRKTLSASVKNRYQTMDECIAALDELAKESEPDNQFIIDARPDCSNTFVGRTAEIEEIYQKLCGSKPVFITGMKGIGKTELAKNYARILGSEYDVVRFAEYNGSLADLISSGELVSIANNSDEAITIDSFAGLVDERTLLIIDNYRTAEGSPSDGKVFDQLASLKCKLLITTYENAQDIYETAEWIELAELSQAEQYSLFEKEYGEPLSNSASKLVLQLLKEIRGFTLLIPLIAKLLKNSSRSFEEVLQKIAEVGTAGVTGKVRHKKDSIVYRANIGDIVSAVLDMSNLSEDEHYVMNCLAVLKGIRIARSILIGWIGVEYDDAISELAFNHWINIDGVGGDALLYIHDVIRDVVRQDKRRLDTSWIKNVIDDYLEEYSVSYMKETDLPYCYPHWLQGTGLGYLGQLTGVTAVRVGKKRELINILLHAINIEQEPETLIEILYRIIKWDLNRTYNYAPDCADLLNDIETTDVFSSLTYNNKLSLLIIHLFYSVKALCNTNRLRAEDEVLTLNHEIIRLSKQIISMAKRIKNRKTQYNIISSIVYKNALLTAGVTLGSCLFITNYPNYAATALAEYTDFVNAIARDIKENYSDFIWTQPEKNYYPFDLNLQHFNDCMEPGSLGKVWREYHEEEKLISKSDDIDYENYLRYEAETSGDPEALHEFELQQQQYKLQEEADELVRQCENLGYLALENPEDWPTINKKHLTDPDTLKEAASLLAQAKEKYELTFDPNDDIFGNMRIRRWLAAACIVACCTGDFSAAKDYYARYLATEYYLGWTAGPEVYNTLNYLGFSEICPDIAKMNIAHLEEIITKPEKPLKEIPVDLFPWPEGSSETEKIEYEKDNQRDRIVASWDVITSILKYAEILGDEELIVKYKPIQKQLEDTGFEFET